jgi:hypothetical protein
MRRYVVLVSLLAVGCLAVAAYQASAKLTLDGTTISTRGIVQNGQLYVPAADVAKALGKSYAFNAASKTGTISDSGGATQNQGVSGKVGEWITNGRTRVKLDPGFTENGDKKLLSFEFRNGEKKAKSYNFGFGDTDYILYDAEGNSKEGELEGSEAYSVDLQPAAMQRIKVYYRFGDDFKPVRLVITLGTQISGNPDKKEVFRIQL